jgi:hypothetical protein
MQVQLLYFADCPNWEVADGRLRALSEEFGFELTHRLVESPEDAETLQFRGSPTVIVDGVDPFAAGDEPVGLSCRVYQTPEGMAGSPTVEQLQSALHLDPRQQS